MKSRQVAVCTYTLFMVVNPLCRIANTLPRFHVDSPGTTFQARLLGTLNGEGGGEEISGFFGFLCFYNFCLYLKLTMQKLNPLQLLSKFQSYFVILYLITREKIKQ